MLAVQQQKMLCCQFVDVSAARRGCHTMKDDIVASLVCGIKDVDDDEVGRPHKRVMT